MLRKRADVRSLSYLLAWPVLVALLWLMAWPPVVQWVLYGLLLFFSVAVGVVHHNHAHLRMCTHRFCNRLIDFVITVLQGHPTFVFYATHNANHHRYHHGPKDIARTYRFGGDTNHLWGYLVHPFQATWVLYPAFLQWLGRMRRRSAGVYGYCLSQYGVLALAWGTLASLNLEKFVLLVLLPQLFGLHWLLATNYLQHAHADGNSPINFARNFSGWLNPLCFNIGMHTAHHLHPRVHWSQLPALHQHYAPQVHPALHAGPLLPYMLRTLVWGTFFASARSTSLMVPRHSVS
jgi:fatty acid desaturase